MMKHIGVFTSGGDAPGMNAAVRAVVRSGLRAGLKVYGIYRGYEGMITGDIREMKRTDVSNIIQLGGTILFSARSERFRTEEGRKLAFENLKSHNIDGLVAIGGDGTFAGAVQFMKEFDMPIIGLPGTIDNDLYGTDFTIGYDTAINTAMTAIDNIKDTATAHDRIFFVEVMGRDAGFIALRSGIATGAEAVLIPESRTNLNALVSMLKDNIAAKKPSNIIIVAEGDDAGGATEISKYVKKHLPHADMRVTILGHTQRGGRPTTMERVRASQMGIQAVRSLLDGKKGIMIGMQGGKMTHVSLEQATKHHQHINPALLELVEILS